MNPVTVEDLSRIERTIQMLRRDIATLSAQGSGRVNGGAIAGLIPPDHILAATTGAPIDTPPVRTARYDAAAGRLYIFDGAAWKSVLLS